MKCKFCNGTGSINTHPAIALIDKDDKHRCLDCDGTGQILQLYKVSIDDECMEAVMARNRQEAKKIAWNDSNFLSQHGEFIELRVNKLEGITRGLKEGIQDDYIDLLIRGFFTMVAYCECPVCGQKDATVFLDEEHGRMYCDKCE